MPMLEILEAEVFWALHDRPPPAAADRAERAGGGDLLLIGGGASLGITPRHRSGALVLAEWLRHLLRFRRPGRRAPWLATF